NTTVSLEARSNCSDEGLPRVMSNLRPCALNALYRCSSCCVRAARSGAESFASSVMVLGSNEILARAPVVRHRTRGLAKKTPIPSSSSSFERLLAAHEPSTPSSMASQSTAFGVKNSRAAGVAAGVGKRLVVGSLTVWFALLGQSAHALPGTHAPAISTYDTRASSVVLAYRHTSSDAGPLNTFSYNANFTNTTGILSAQFGIHYVNFDAKANDSTAHGVGASGVALFVLPVAARWDDGVPKAAIAFDIGSVPTVYVSGQRQYVTLPLVFGFGVPLSPHRAITLTPWFEASLSANLDTVFKSTDISVDPSWVTVTQDPNNPTQTKVGLKDGAVEAAVKNGVSIDSGFYVPMRAGLEADIHVSQTVDFNLYSSIATLGGAFGGASAFTLGAGLSFRWDSIVPAVLPVDRRLEGEQCEAVEARFR